MSLRHLSPSLFPFRSFVSPRFLSFSFIFSWWVLQHCTGFARLVWARLRVHRAFVSPFCLSFSFIFSLFIFRFAQISDVVCSALYKVAKTHRIPYLYRSFSAKVSSSHFSFCLLPPPFWMCIVCVGGQGKRRPNISALSYFSRSSIPVLSF